VTGDLLRLVLGMALLYGAAETLVRGASRLAESLGLAPLVVGLTVVAFGTSAPEMVVSVVGAVEGRTGVALGNVIGSNIFNIGLVLGLAALVRPVSVDARVVRREIPILLAASVGMVVLMWDGELSRLDGAAATAAFVAYMAFMVWQATRESEGTEAYPASKAVAPRSRVGSILLVVVGLGGLVVGAHLLVEAAVAMARVLGLSELVIGLTIVAAGTSLPEVATSTVASARGEGDMAVGNVVGSNLFNLLAILGVSALVRPIPVPAGGHMVELLVMVGAVVLLLPLARTGAELSRWEGAGLVMGFVAFVLFGLPG
jgi:cation:H+ antiporter